MTGNRTLIYNARMFTPVDAWQPGWLLVDGSRIDWMSPGTPPDFAQGSLAREIDAQGMSLLPGFIDLHVHGAMGHEAMDASPEGLYEMARFYAQHGVTGFLATTWAASGAAIKTVLDAFCPLVGPVLGGATLLGMHLEGPYLNPVRAGAQDSNLIRRAAREEALGWLDTGVVRLIALAPEYEENLWLVDECARRGITVSAAHTSADFAAMQQAVQRGVRQVTHCFNAMTPLSHREPGTVGAAMALPEFSCELIADNIHVAPPVQKILVQVKGPGRVILVTDALRGAGLPDGDYPIDVRVITIRNGAARLPDGTLAGSILTMDKALYNIQQSTGLSLKEAWPMSSLNAARSIGLSNRKGSLEAGKDADLVLVDDSGKVHLTIAEGNIVWDAMNRTEET